MADLARIPELLPSIIEMVAKVVFIFTMNMGVFAPLLGWVERKQSALMQDRIGANRADILGITAFGLLHTLTDAIKLLTKEDFIPRGADKPLHYLAPFIAVVPALIAFAVIPFGGQYVLWGHKTNLVIADLDVGILFVFAVASISTYGSVIAGWASNNNWSLLGGIRVGAQMLSYEVAMGLTLVGVFMVYGSLRMTDIGVAQENFFHWGIFLQPLGFILFITCALAENKRTPFDIPEAEAELVAGYFTEYSGLKFAMFWMAEFLEMVTISGVLVALFFGGWQIPFVTHEGLVKFFGFLGSNFAQVAVMVVHVTVFWVKVLGWIFLLMLIRWTLPRFRYDQVMELGWKIILPLALVNIFITGAVMLMVM
ncbi:MAG: NADH-quinone oxidoreductase subunit NuoH [Nitrospinae bacterium]|nr:NADH-quinone oxidoreductase subunit NuoH [Nitrospinota bacterium]